MPGCLEEMEAESWRVGRLTDWAREEQLVRRRPEVGARPRHLLSFSVSCVLWPCVSRSFYTVFPSSSLLPAPLYPSGEIWGLHRPSALDFVPSFPNMSQD